jgi:hypothetical protein
MSALKYEKHREISSPPQEGTNSILPSHALQNALQNQKLWIAISDRSPLGTGGCTSRKRASVAGQLHQGIVLKRAPYLREYLC